MKLFIIGKNGQMGKDLYKDAKKGGYQIYSYGKKELDVTDHKKVRTEIEKIKPNIVINTAALHATIENENNPEKLFNINSFAVKNLALICKEMNIKFVTYSSDYVFDGTKGSLYEEEDPQTPVQMFGISKHIGEVIAINYCPNSIVIRSCGIYGGKKGSRAKGNFVLNILKDAKNSKIIEVSSEQIVNPSYSKDISKATLELLEKNPTGGIYHIVNSGFCSWAEFAQEIMNIKNLKVKITPVDRKGISGGIRRPIFSALKNTKAKKLGVDLRDWKPALKQYLETL